MGYRRETAATLLEGDDLTRAMVGIGMLFAERGEPEANIEDTLVSASLVGLERDELRVLAVLTTWMEVHQERVNVDRLLRAVAAVSSKRVRAYWAAVGHWLSHDRRYVRLAKVYSGRKVNLLAVGTAFHVERSGEDSRFEGGPLTVPANVLRDRKADVLAPAELAKRHCTYRWRVAMGPSYRADMWAAMEGAPHLSPAQLARKTYGSFATAWRVKNDWQLLAA
jgi:hypothetical protein